MQSMELPNFTTSKEFMLEEYASSMSPLSSVRLLPVELDHVSNKKLVRR